MPPRRPDTSALPILPLVAAGMMMLVAGQLALWVWDIASKPREAPDAVAAAMAGEHPLAALAKQTPPALEPDADTADAKPWRVVLPVREGNLQFGDPTSDIVVTMLSDPSCGECRQQVRTWLQLLPRNVRIVSKFWPQNMRRTTPGILMELARREGVTEAFLRELEKAEGDLDDAQLLSLLERAGVSLEKQRAALSNGEQGVGRTLQADLARGYELQLPPPPLMVVNGYVMDGKALKPEMVADYVEKLRAHQPLDSADDRWLMEK